MGFLRHPIYGPIPFCKVSADVFGEEEVAVIYPAFYGPIPFCKVSADVFGEEEVAVIYPACVRATRPVATMEIRALHSYQPIGLEGHWDEQVDEVPV